MRKVVQQASSGTRSVVKGFVYSTAVAALLAAAPAQANDVDEMRAELQNLLDRMERVDWHVGSMVVPPTNWFHQHFNGGTEPARYLALRWGSQKYGFSLGSASEGEADVSVKLGGAQIEYEDEEHIVHDMFAETLAKVGGESKMAEFLPRLAK